LAEQIMRQTPMLTRRTFAITCDRWANQITNRDWEY
jgi:hypothetical protein